MRFETGSGFISSIRSLVCACFSFSAYSKTRANCPWNSSVSASVRCSRARRATCATSISPVLAMGLNLKPKMADEPDHRQAERDNQNQENNPALASFLPQRLPSAGTTPDVTPFVLESDRNIEAAPPLTGAGQ